MDGISALTARIAQIQTQIGSLQTAQAVAPAQVSQPVGASSGSSGAAFAQALADATAQTAAAQPVAAAPRAAAPSAGTDRTAGSTAVDATGVPLVLKKFGNGHVPASALSNVAGTDAVLWAPAARALEDLRAAAAKDGVSIGINDSYRSYERQEAMVKTKGLYGHGGLAAQPGTSMHGWGVATDLHLDARALSWMKAHADDYGFVDNVAGESWHWQWKPGA
ncbi:M15 family metallopeptidase [Cellulomonas edaphi]|uniref:M15 family metallopeptidase n=1 Tax=Cellulomonas edaphi TaxID=3053468 RepID=A0ABT7S478_9CELL|nr:M15 family metallopeptidase [Cellulomons edaphi]MDM7830319.1 M15 family metallopeptidase [Cellulomons edaphi]